MVTTVAHRTPTRRRHQSGARARALAGRQVEIPSEPLDDFWDVDGAKYPGSPRVTKDEPMDVMIMNVRGARVCVARKKLQYFRNTGTAPDKLWLWRPCEAPQLWRDRHHHSLTHALRLLQVCSRTSEDHCDKPSDRVLRGRIEPGRLLLLCGADFSLANELVYQLVELRLLRTENDGDQLKWYINTKVKAVDQDRRLLGAAELPQMILPEFWTQPPPEGDDVQMLEAAGGAEADQELPGKPEPLQDESGVQSEEGTVVQLAAGKPTPLHVYRVLVSLWPTDAPEEDGFAVWSPAEDLKVTLARLLECSDYASHRLLLQLKDAGVYYPKAGGKGKPFRRYLKLDAEETVANFQAAQATGQSGGRSRHSGGSTRQTGSSAQQTARRPAAVAAGTQSIPPDSVKMTPEQHQQLWDQAVAKLHELTELVKTQREQLAEKDAELARERDAHEQTKTELAQAVEAAENAGPVILVPAELAQYLDK